MAYASDDIATYLSRTYAEVILSADFANDAYISCRTSRLTEQQRYLIAESACTNGATCRCAQLIDSTAEQETAAVVAVTSRATLQARRASEPIGRRPS